MSGAGQQSQRRGQQGTYVSLGPDRAELRGGGSSRQPARLGGKKAQVAAGPPASRPGLPGLTAAGQQPTRVLRVRLRPPSARRHLAVERLLLRAAPPRPRPGARRRRALLHHRVRVGHGEGPGPGHRDASAGGEGGEEVKRLSQGREGVGSAPSSQTAGFLSAGRKGLRGERDGSLGEGISVLCFEPGNVGG